MCSTAGFGARGDAVTAGAAMAAAALADEAELEEQQFLFLADALPQHAAPELRIEHARKLRLTVLAGHLDSEHAFGHGDEPVGVEAVAAVHRGDGAQPLGDELGGLAQLGVAAAQQ